jgi:hypothetical protein
MFHALDAERMHQVCNKEQSKPIFWRINITGYACSFGFQVGNFLMQHTNDSYHQESEQNQDNFPSSRMFNHTPEIVPIMGNSPKMKPIFIRTFMLHLCVSAPIKTLAPTMVSEIPVEAWTSWPIR